MKLRRSLTLTGWLEGIWERRFEVDFNLTEPGVLLIYAESQQLPQNWTEGVDQPQVGVDVFNQK